jgi:alpha-L-fucosidase 2
MKRLSHLLIVVVVVASGLTGTGAQPAAAAPNDAAFSTSTGTLNVDHGGYLSKHDIVYNRPNTNPNHGLTVGNGRMGAMAWHANGLTMQLSNVDVSQQTAFGAGLLNLRTTPAMDSGYEPTSSGCPCGTAR